MTTAAGTRRWHRLRRHVGIVGLLFASVGSIIGSGWLFGALNASQAAGPAAVISRALGGLMIPLIAIVHAELGTMFPLSGGVVRSRTSPSGRSPATAPGGSPGSRVATTAPIEVMAAPSTPRSTPCSTAEHTVDGEIVHTLTGWATSPRSC